MATRPNRNLAASFPLSHNEAPRIAAKHRPVWLAQLARYHRGERLEARVALMNEKALIEIFAGMASLVCLVSGLHRDERRKIAIRVATIRRTKVGYQQIQRHNEMALSPPYAFTFAIDR
jgi:hypothetical protein